ncbi:hypothetical protein AMS68_003509 [Peltaster fructicola]|uniref:EthD domain-containing protein n=1 Tax=Peltaster fructicola TaxID=286661 RepID=A0A6H0XT92_9PEZI|nr:hypothetical protein AMS68_003509 [Peltaster fructicola]
MATATVLYPQGAKFDMDYYLQTHMPLVQKHWGPIGLKSWKITKIGDADAPFIVQATLEWASMDEFKSASSGDTAKTVFGDIPNFCDKQPTVLTGSVVGQS